MQEHKRYKVYKKSEYLDDLKKYISENKTNNEIAEIFGVSRNTIIKWVRDNDLTGLRTKYKHERVQEKKKQVRAAEPVTTYNAEKGCNADRHMCKKCKYRMTGSVKSNLQANCDYIGCNGHSRGCDVENCNKFVKGKKVRAKQIFRRRKRGSQNRRPL